MKLLKTLALCSLLVLGNQAIAKTTPISFAKGSHCGSFEGDYTSRTFTLSTRANQTVYVTVNHGESNVADIVITDPKGRKARADGAALEFVAKVKGVHKIKVVPYHGASYANIEFCVY